MPICQHLMISTHDDLSTIHSTFFEQDSKKFAGKPDENGQYRKWGLPAIDPQYFGSPRMCLRIINFNGCYEPGEMPEQQFVKVLARKKWESLQKVKKTIPLNYEYILKVSLPTKPQIYRKIKCYNGIDLFKFADSVLIPSMGWTRNHHTWIFEDPSDGAVIGHQNSKAIDHSQISYLCWDILDDNDIKIGELLKKKGDKLIWTYDLQQIWEHTIELEEINSCLNPEMPTCFEGAYHCPPEDSRGLSLRGIPGYQKEITETFQKGLKFHHKNPVNLHQSEWNWKLFDTKSVNSAIEIAWNSPESQGTDTRKSIFLSRMSVNQSSEKISKNPNSSDLDITSSELEALHNETKRDEDKSCVVCKKTENTKKCSRCQQCFYCSRECQRKDWPQHKANCK